MYGDRQESSRHYRDITDIEWTIEDIDGHSSHSVNSMRNVNSMSMLAGKQFSAGYGRFSAGCALFRLHLGIQRDGHRRFHHDMASLILVLVYILVLAINRELSAAAAFHVCFDA